MVGVSQVKDDRAVRALYFVSCVHTKPHTGIWTYGTTTAAGEDVVEVDGAVEGERAIRKDVNPVSLVVSRSVEDGDLYKSQFPLNDEKVLFHLHRQPVRSSR